MITGGDTGLGREVSRDLAGRGARIIMVCQNIKNGEIVKGEILAESENPNVILKELDLSSYKSIRSFADDINRTEKKIDILINNAGLGSTTGKSIEGTPISFAVNLYGPFLLTHLLLDAVRKSPAGRIIFVSSLLSYFGCEVDWTKMTEQGYVSKNRYYQDNYSVSKYGLTLISREFSKRLRSNTKITVNAIHPGLIPTTIFAFLPWAMRTVLNIFNFLTKDTVEGAQTTIHVAVADEVDNVTGKFYVDCAEYNILRGERHLKNGKVLWEKCETLVQLKPNEKIK